MIDRLARLDVAGDTHRRLRLPEGCLVLRRAWPRSGSHLLLEYVSGDGMIVPGQWFADADTLGRVASETARRCPGMPPVVLGTKNVMLQPWGTDRRLRGLAPLLSRAGTTLLAHRPERRAVVEQVGPDGEHYGKVFRPSRLSDVLTRARAIEALPQRGFAVPDILESDHRQGVVICSALAGTSLYELLSSGDRLVAGARAAGHALRGLHGAPTDRGAVHDAEAEVEMLRHQLDRLASLEPEMHRRLRGASEHVFSGLVAGSCSLALIHRDLYDKQIFVDDRSGVGLLDFDTVTVGEPALDIANTLVHFELRAIQGLCSFDLAAAAADALLEGYQPDPAVRVRLRPYGDAARLRLAGLYAFRPPWRHLPAQLLDRLEREAPVTSGA